jgi:hypothetical protein
LVDHCITEKLSYGIIERRFCGMERKITLWFVVTNLNGSVGVKKAVIFCTDNERPCIIRRSLPIWKYGNVRKLRLAS